MTLVWLSPGLPADRAELAAGLPSDVALVAPNPSADPNSAADVGVLPVGSLCVATVFEHELLARLAGRPAGVRLLIVGPPDGAGGSPNAAAPAFGRPADLVTAASSVPELVAAIQQAIHLPSTPGSPAMGVPAPGAPTTGIPATAEGEELAAATSASTKVRTPWRTRLVATGAVLAGLAIGGIVIGTTEGTSSATAGRAGVGGFGGFGGGAGGAGRQFPGIGGTGTVTGLEKQVLACLRQQGIKTPTNQLLQNTQDPALRQAFLVCIQQLRGGGTAGAGAGGPSSQITGRP